MGHGDWYRNRRNATKDTHDEKGSLSSRALLFHLPYNTLTTHINPTIPVTLLYYYTQYTNYSFQRNTIGLAINVHFTRFEYNRTRIEWPVIEGEFIVL